MKRSPKEGPLELINERQETMFDTALSSAVDDFIKAERESALWKERRVASAKALISEMKRLKMARLTIGREKVIVYKYTDAKEGVSIKPFREPGRRKKAR